MSTSTFFIPPVNILGAGSLQAVKNQNDDLLRLRQSLIVTDRVLVQLGIVADIQNALLEHDISSVVL